MAERFATPQHILSLIGNETDTLKAVKKLADVLDYLFESLDLQWGREEATFQRLEEKLIALQNSLIRK